jgi:hypothetical protein
MTMGHELEGPGVGNDTCPSSEVPRSISYPEIPVLYQGGGFQGAKGSAAGYVRFYGMVLASVMTAVSHAGKVPKP